MAYQEYENLTVEQAVAKLKAKSFWDAEDQAFAKARAEFFTEHELEVITAENHTPAVEAPATVEPAVVVGDETVPSTEPTTPEQAPVTSDNTSEPAELTEELLMKKTLPELQALCADLELDTSGTKKVLAERILEAKKA